MDKPDTFTPAKELQDYYRQYHRGEIKTPPGRLMQPEDFDFPTSAGWRDFYEQRYGGLIDFPVSSTYARHYRGIGLMPPVPDEAKAVSGQKLPRSGNWLRVSVAPAKPRKKPGVKGVLR